MNSIKVENPKSSVFDLTHDVKLSCNMGLLVPTMVMDCVPGDKIDISQDALVRFAPLISPMYQRVKVTFHTWAVPYRILWDNWEKYITETKTAGVLPAFPYITMLNGGGNYTPLADYLGIPNPANNPGASEDERISAMRFAAYQCIYNNFYRDENLVTQDWTTLVDGDNTAVSGLTNIRRRAWLHDYFTSNLPFAQKGEAVKMPVTFDDVPVKMNENFYPGETDVTLTGVTVPGGTTTNFNVKTEPPSASVTEDMFANTAAMGSITNINDFRLAYQLQRYLERAARSGTRLVEWIKGMFGVTLPDYTAQIPQYIGGSVSPVQISEVLNTAGTVGELPQGNMAGRGLSVAQGRNGKYYAREHCVILTLMSITPETTYAQGLDREWLKINDPKDFMNPMFAHLGEQETKVKEIYAYTVNGDNTFGYLPRYSEYRTIPSRLAGEFRTTLDYWTQARLFSTEPALNKQFIECDPTHRVFADTDPATQKLYVHCLNKVRAVRPLPKYGTPSL